MKKRKVFGLSVFCLIAAGSLYSQTKQFGASEAKDHIGERATVCGNVVSARYALLTKGETTFLNLDQQYPKQVFTAVIWSNDLTKFGAPEVKYKDKRICVTGKITSFQCRAEIVATDQTQIETQK